MSRRTITMTTLIMMAGFARGVSAQDPPRVGLSMGYPATIGVIWEVNERFALRPEIGVQRSSADQTDAISFGLSAGDSLDTSTIVSTSTSDLTQVNAGLSALIYLSHHDALCTYVSPRWAYSRTSNSLHSTLSEVRNFGSSASGQSLSGSFGARYALGRRFGAFGEVGLSFTRVVTSPDERSMALFGSAQDVSRSFNTRSAAGVILYF